MQAWQQALGRMTMECAALGGDGVVAANLTMAPFPASPNCLECRVIGTAVRAQGAVRPPRPFTTHLDGQGFTKLLSAGWISVDLLVGMSIGMRHADWTTRQQSRFLGGNQEVTGWSDLVTATRHDASHQLSRQATHAGADGIVLGDTDLRIWRRTCARARRRGNDSDQADHVAEAMLVGTAVAAFQTERTTPPALSIMPLNPGFRRARARASTRLRPLPPGDLPVSDG